MKILVTGGVGFIGRHLVTQLLARGDDEIVILDNLKRGARPMPGDFPRDVEFIESDIREEAFVRSAMRGVSVVFHLAAHSNVIGSIKDPYNSFTSNVLGTYNVLAAAYEAGVHRVVFTSSREVYGEPHSIPVSESTRLLAKNEYGASKIAGELYCQLFAEKGLKTTILRLTNVYGAGDQGRVIPLFLGHAVRQEPLTLYGGEQIIDFVWIDTVVNVLIDAGFGRYVEQPVNVGSGKGVSIQVMAKRILDLVGSRSEIRIGAERPVEVTRFVADVSRAVSLFGLAVPDDPLGHLPTLVSAQLVDSLTHVGSGH